jgi:2-iminobutanoate/2-iminopropanoate deaminase
MDHRIIYTREAPEPIGPYSQAIVSGMLIFTSGQIAIDPKTGDLTEGDVEAQTGQVLENLKSVLTAAGSSLDNVLKTTIFLNDMDDFPRVNAVYARYFNKAMPARSTVEVSRLPKNVRIEIDCIAAVTE